MLNMNSWSSPPVKEKASDKAMRLPDGRLLSFCEYGDANGMPMFAFHGTPGSRFMFRLSDAPAAELGVRVIAVERPGFGKSSYQKDRTLADWPKDVEALANHLGIGRFAVAGISGGGPYAVACAALLPNRVMAAGVISPIGPVVPPEGVRNIGLAHRIVFRLMHKVVPLGVVMASTGRFMFMHRPEVVSRLILKRAAPADRAVLAQPKILTNLLEGVREGFRPGIRGVMREMTLFGSPWQLPLQKIQAPVFLWQGRQDRNVPVAAALHLASRIPNCQLTLIEGAGHYWIFEHIGAVLQTLKTACEKD